MIKKFKSELHVFWLISRPPKPGCFFIKFTVEKVLKSFSGRNNSLEPPVFGFCDCLLYDLEESIELRALISWVLGLYCHFITKQRKLATF